MAVRLLALSVILPLTCTLADPYSGLFSLVDLKANLCVTSDLRAVTCGVQEIHRNQLWVENGNDDRIFSLADRQCLERTNDRTLTVSVCKESALQDWEWSAVDLTVRNRWNGRHVCLELVPSSQKIELSPCHTGQLSQKFLKKWWKPEALEAPLKEAPSCSSHTNTTATAHPLVAWDALLDPKGLLTLLALNMIVAMVVVMIVIVMLFLCRFRCKDRTCSRMVQVLNELHGEVEGKHFPETLTTSRKALTVEQRLDGLEKVMGNVTTKITQLAAMEVQEAEDSSSAGTISSWTHVTSGQPCCFLPETYLKMATEAGHEDVPAHKLFQGAQVVAANGTLVKVLRPPEQHQVDAIIQLQAGPSCLVVSPDHRILTPGPGNKTIKAEELEVGSDVILDGSPAKLTSLEWKVEPTIVLKIIFTPDLPVAGFLRPPAILSKGSREKLPVRRGTRKVEQGGDTQTMPDTEPPLTP